ncbi:molybdate ABC transporter substrate-binding protein [Reyranella sp.]|uniref:molybdate ABC transporter substrate-binding protein n=1 Tax=Reyranella sp. TaxID=1929291 RepID=UPI003D1226D2
MTGGHAITPETVSLRILAGGGMAGVWADLKPRFEQTSGHRLDLFFATTPNLIQEATSGRPFDAGIVPADVMQDPAARARFAPGATMEVARAGIGVAVRSGAPKPDIGTCEAFKTTLLKASSVATVPESATGYAIARVFERLGITEQMKSKTKAQPGPAQVVAIVASGEVELALFLVNVLTTPGLDVVGPFPPELQEDVVFAAALSADTKKASAAQALLAYLESPAGVAIIRSKGMTPG